MFDHGGKSMRRSALAAAVLLASAAPALAWSEPECTRLEQGQPLCAVTTWYDLDGRPGRLKIMLADGVFYLLLQHEAWRLPEGTVPVLAHVDDQPPVERQAMAREDGVLVTLLQDDLPALASGQSLTVQMPQAGITYPLGGSLEALDALLKTYAAFSAGVVPAGSAPR
jgi:hypothetical protein